MKKKLRQSFQARLDLKNHKWLKEMAFKEDLSINWMLNKVVSDARLAEREGVLLHQFNAQKESASEISPSEALISKTHVSIKESDND